ncbi:MAG: response regulator [Phormidium tanganyikae FI6-MK23]|jgi:CheY-like chemotaxis protein|nr:response regulator [Phormidium tanganyikae FI6-MK23]
MTDLGNHMLLVVEDNEDDILFIERAFDEANLSNPLQIIRDGDSAVDYLSGVGEYGNRDRYPLPPLILLDIRLPRRSGLEVLTWIKQQPGLRRLPVVMLTTSRENSDINRAYDLGANSYLLKPVGPDALREMVKTLNFYWLILNQRPDVEDG